MTRRILIVAAAMLCGVVFASPAGAAISTSWVAPPNGSTFDVGTLVNPLGIASASGTSGGSGQPGASGLDLALVLDSSGSMAGSLRSLQQNAAKALVDALPMATTSVAVIEYDSNASVVRQLSPLTSDKAAIITAINSVDAWGGTAIGTGISAAITELLSSRHTTGRSRMVVVTSDGGSYDAPGEVADDAISQGIDAVHSVGISSSHNTNVMKHIVDGADDTYGTADDHGVYTDGSNLDELIGIFDGTGGNLVGIDHVDLEMPDGTVLADIAIDGLGNFEAPDWHLWSGANVFTATAYDTVGNSASQSLTIYGGDRAVPEPATLVMWSVLTLAGGGLARYRRRRR